MQSNPEKTKYQLGVISDTQDLEEPAQIKEALKPLKELKKEGVNLDMLIHIGDISGAGAITDHNKKNKKKVTQYEIDKQNNELSEESEKYQELINSPNYKKFYDKMEKYGVEQDFVIYSLWELDKTGELNKAMADMKGLIKNATKQLGDFKTDVKFIIGNADRSIPQRLEMVQELLKEQNIESCDSPIHLSLDEKNSLVFWPSVKINEKNNSQMDKLQNTIENFTEEMKDKETVLIFAHETPFKGPKKPGVYQQRVDDAGLEGSARVPYKQYLPVSKYVLELCRRLPAETKISLACGHMHVPRETIQAGTKYLKFDDEGKAKLRLFGADKDINREKYDIKSGEKRTIDLYYLPAGEVGKFEIDSEGNVTYQKLDQESN